MSGRYFIITDEIHGIKCLHMYIILQLACCMSGPKRINAVTLCSASCCDGYVEEVATIESLGLLIWCEKVPDFTLPNVSCRSFNQTSSN